MGGIEIGCCALIRFQMKGKLELNPLMGQRLALTLALLGYTYYIYISVSPIFVAFPLKVDRLR